MALDGGYGWVIVAGAVVSQFLVFGLGRTFGVFYGEFLDRYGQTAAQTAWIGAMYQFCSQVLGPVGGLLADKFGCRVVGMCGSVLMGLGLALSFFATNIVFLYVTYGVITGLGASLIITSTFLVISKYFDKRKGTAMGLATMGCGFGTFVLPPLYAYLISQYTILGTLLIVGGLELNNAVCTFLYRPLPPTRTIKPQSTTDTQTNAVQMESAVASEEQELNDSNAVHQQNSSTQEENIREDKNTGCRTKVAAFASRYFSMLSNTSFILYGFEIMCMSIAIQSFFTYLPSHAKQNGVSEVSAALLVSVFGAADIVGRFGSGFVFDVAIIRPNRHMLHCALLIGGGTISILTGLAQKYFLFCILTSAFGLLMGAFHGQRATVVTQFVPRHQMPVSVGFVLTFQSLGSLTGTPISGLLRDHFLTYNVSFFFSGCCAIFAGSVFMVYHMFIRGRCGRSELSYKVNNTHS